MTLYISGTADPAHVIEGRKFSSKSKYGAAGTMPLKTVGNGVGPYANHHLASRTSAEPGTIYLAPVDQYGPPVAYQGDVWLRKDDPNFNPAYWREDVTMFGLKGAMPIRGSEVYYGWREASVGAPSVPGRVHLKIPSGAYVAGTEQQGWDVGIYKDEAGFHPAHWRSDVNLFGLQGEMPVITSGSDPAQGVAMWADGGLAVYPNPGYRPGGAGPGEIKVSAAQLLAVGLKQGVRYAIGSHTVQGWYSDVFIGNLGWQPKSAIARKADGSNEYGIYQPDLGINIYVRDGVVWNNVWKVNYASTLSLSLFAPEGHNPLVGNFNFVTFE